MALHDTDRYAMLDRLADEFADRFRRGERPSLGEYAQKYPELADDIRELFPALVQVEQLEEHRRDPAPLEPVAPSPSLKQIGDYRVLREVGRGGMGVVYEAEQLSLGRRVALKVLRGHSAGDDSALERFKREARSAARLHHTNIVPVFDVGQQGDVCFYAMQFIQGQGLDQVIEELHRLRVRSGQRDQGRLRETDAATRASDVRLGPVARSLMTGAFQPAAAPPEKPAEQTEGYTVHALDDTGPRAALADSSSAVLPGRVELASAETSYRHYFRSVAHLGHQTATALAHAHARGIIHRDIKPSNLLLDAAGVVWVTDFGLAKSDDLGLTHTGDIVGTIRYMAPERFRGECDARADLYALGLTLYELLTLRPAFDAVDRLRLMEQIKSQEPPRPRALDPRIPRDLETVVLKAADKDPKRRYQSADELAEDLRRFLAGEPILARRASLWERAVKWGRRHPAVAALVTVSGLAVLALLVLLGALWRNAEARAVAVKKLEDAQGQLDALAEDVQQQQHLAGEKRAEVRRLEEAAAQARLNGRRALYLRDMHLAQLALEQEEIGRLIHLLEGHRPPPGKEDVRGFEWYHLWRLCHRDRGQLRGHSELIDSVQFSGDGKVLFTVDAGGTMRWCDAVTGDELASPPGQPRAVATAALALDGRTVAAAGKDGSIRLWDRVTDRVLRTLPGRLPRVKGLAFDPSGRTLATGEDRTVRLWDLATGKERSPLRGHTGTVFTVRFSPDGKLLATSGEDRTVRLWDVEEAKERLVLRGWGEALVSRVAFAPDGRSIAFGEFHPHQGRNVGAVRVHSIEGKLLGQWMVRGGGAYSVAFSPDGKTLAAGGNTWAITLWDAATGQLRDTFYTRGGRTYDLAFSPDSKTLASGHWDAQVRLWDVAGTPALLAFRAHTSRVAAFALAPDGRTLATSAGDPVVCLWDVATGKPRSVLPGRGEPVGALAFSPDGKALATGSATGTVRVWDLATLREQAILRGHEGTVSSLSFAPDGRTLASAAFDWTVRLWDVAAARQRAVLRGHVDRQVWSVAFSPDGKTVASGGEDGTVRLWDPEAGRLRATLEGGGTGILRIAFSGDGERIAAGNWSAFVSLWETRTGKPSGRLEGHAGHVLPVAFAPDGRTLASGSTDGTVRLWDVSTKQERFTLRCHGSDVKALAFAPEGRRLVTADAAGIVRVWGGAGQEPTSKEESPRQQRLLWERGTDAAEAAGEWRLAGLLLTRVLAEAPTGALHARRGRALAEQDQWGLAAADLSRALELGTDTPAIRLQLAQLRLAAGDRKGYQDACERLLRAGLPPERESARHLAQVCTLSPGAVTDYTPLERWAALDVAAHPDEYAALHTLGAVLCRGGKAEEAVRRLREAVRLSKGADTTADWLYLAIAHHQLRQHNEARECFTRGSRWPDPGARAKPGDSGKIPSWEERLRLLLLRREAAALLNLPPMVPGP